jgi:hypothetical protein
LHKMFSKHFLELSATNLSTNKHWHATNQQWECNNVVRNNCLANIALKSRTGIEQAFDELSAERAVFAPQRFPFVGLAHGDVDRAEQPRTRWFQTVATGISRCADYFC